VIQHESIRDREGYSGTRRNHAAGMRDYAKLTEHHRDVIDVLPRCDPRDKVLALLAIAILSKINDPIRSG